MVFEMVVNELSRMQVKLHHICKLHSLHKMQLAVGGTTYYEPKSLKKYVPIYIESTLISSKTSVIYICPILQTSNAHNLARSSI